MKNKNIRLISIIAAVCLILAVLIVVSNSGDKNAVKDDGISQEQIDKLEAKKKEILGSNYTIPDLSGANVPAASTEATDCTDETKFVSALEAFANPDGNKYDALSILGAFRYNEEGDKLMERLETASKSWHEPIEANVGEKCVVDISLKSTAPYDMADEVVVEWNAANGKKCLGYSRITCDISNVYSAKKLTYSFDIVNVDGNWYLAQTSILNKLQSILTNEIYK